MTKYYQNPIRFSSVRRRKVEAEFSGGSITGNGGILLLSEVDRQLGLTRALSRCLGDVRRQASCAHGLQGLFRQRLYALALGHEDLNDHGDTHELCHIAEPYHGAAFYDLLNRVLPDWPKRKIQLEKRRS